MVFIFANGPVTAAIIVWRLSLVYHDFDRMVSIYIHIMPAALSLVLRWHIIPPDTIQALSIFDYITAAGGYIVWQTLYYLKTEVWDRDILDNNPKLLTSLRWLAADKKNPTARGVLKLLRKIGIMRPDEDYVSTEFKTKMVFMTSQFVYSCITFIPTVFLYQWHSLHVAYIIMIFTIAVYNGASYYIDIFSKRYQLQFEKKEDMQRVVQAAAEIAYQAATAVHPSGSNSSLAVSRGNSGIFSPAKPPRMQRAESGNSSEGRGVTLEEGYTVGVDHATGSSVGGEVDALGGTVGALGRIDEADIRSTSPPQQEEYAAESSDETTAQQNQLAVDDSIKDIIEVATKAFVDEWAEEDYDSDDNTSDHSGRDRFFSEEMFAAAEDADGDREGHGDEGNGGSFAGEVLVDEYVAKNKDA